MTITEIFDGKEWKIKFETKRQTKVFGAFEFPFTAREVTGRDADREEELDAAGDPTVMVWEMS